MSLGWLCSPASTSSIMNGVHCQIISIITDSIGKRLSQSKWPIPNGRSTKLTTPKVESSMVVFHNRAAATGMIRNGVISKVRTMPRPRNFRSRTRASATEEFPVQDKGERDADDHRNDDRPAGHDHRVDRGLAELAVLEHVEVVGQADEVLGARADQTPGLQRVVERHEEGQLGHDDREHQGRQQGCAPDPPLAACVQPGAGRASRGDRWGERRHLGLRWADMAVEPVITLTWLTWLTCTCRRRPGRRAEPARAPPIRTAGRRWSSSSAH